MDIHAVLKPHELKTVIGARLQALVDIYPVTHVGIFWHKRDLIGELARLIALAESLPDK